MWNILTCISFAGDAMTTRTHSVVVEYLSNSIAGINTVFNAHSMCVCEEEDSRLVCWLEYRFVGICVSLDNVSFGACSSSALPARYWATFHVFISSVDPWTERPIDVFRAYFHSHQLYASPEWSQNGVCLRREICIYCNSLLLIVCFFCCCCCSPLMASVWGVEFCWFSRES